MISISEEDAHLERDEVKLLLDHRVDALVLASAQTPACKDLFRATEEHKVPYVLIDRKIAGLKANYVGVNDATVGQIATEHLIACGPLLAHIGGPKIGSAIGRMEGYRRASRPSISIDGSFVVYFC